jgi:hypothetical protein
MKKVLFSVLALILGLSGCTKKEDTRTSGTDTIDNIIYYSTTYYTYGFTFSKAKLISTENNPGPDIALYVSIEDGTPTLTLQANNLKSSFYKVPGAGTQADFDNLKSITVPTFIDMADPIADNQIWIYRSSANTYTKLRIVSTVNEVRSGIDYGECTFQWVYQPDGTLTFP